MPRAEAVRTVSQRLRRQLREDFGVADERISVLPMHVPDFSSVPDRDYSRRSPFIFLTVGRLVPVKNISMQIRALALISQEIPDAQLHIAGDGPDEPGLRSLAEELSVSGKVCFLGRLDKASLAEAYARADAFMLTSLAEGWPLVIAEAAWAALPIIMTDVGSAGEFIINGKNGLVVPPDDADDLAEAMRLLYSDEPMRRELAQSAKLSASSLPGHDAVLQGYLGSWKMAIDNKKRK
jgi:glycosyltransferase involved in cell wall biosynthesis